jgi:hypothetical protein
MRIATFSLALALSACKIYGGLTEDDIAAVQDEIAADVKERNFTVIEIKIDREIDDTRASGFVTVAIANGLRSTSHCVVLMKGNGQRV